MEEDLMQRLPHDVLADILRRLEMAPRLLAASRCVCKTWRTVVDTRGLLHADLLPLSVSGIFTHPTFDMLPYYFALPPQHSSTGIAFPFDYLDTDEVDSLMVAQHCNGLLMLDVERVLNPATGQWARLPSPPPLRLFGPDDLDGREELDEDENACLVFDPTVSPHYQVLLINSVPFTPSPDCYVVKASTKAREWPPSSYTIRVFSSKTRLWEKKNFVRQGEAGGTVRDMLWTLDPNYCYAAYWRGAVYIHQCGFIMRMNLSSYTYQVIGLPESDVEELWDEHYYLGKSNGGVYRALFTGYSGLGLQVWFLDETCGQMKWALKRDVDLHPLLANFTLDYGDGPSTIQCVHHNEDDMRKFARSTLSILGFHPYKEIVFIHTPPKE